MHLLLGTLDPMGLRNCKWATCSYITGRFPLTWNDGQILAIRYMKKKLKESNAVAAKETESRTTDDLEHQAGHDGSADPAERENGRVKTVRRSGRVQALPAPTLSSITLVILLSGMVAAEEPHDSHPTQDHSEYDDAPGPICIVSLIAIYLFMAVIQSLDLQPVKGFS